MSSAEAAERRPPRDVIEAIPNYDIAEIPEELTEEYQTIEISDIVRRHIKSFREGQGENTHRILDF
jgi:hypothetical protein